MPLVGNLDSDRLLAGDRRENPDVGGGERVGEVVAQLCHLGDLRPGRKLKLVAAHVGTADHPKQLCLDSEVSKRLEQRLGDRLAILHVRPWISLAAGQELPAGERVVALIGRCHSLALVAHRRAWDVGTVVGPGLPLGRICLGAARLVGALRVFDLLLRPLAIVISGRCGVHLAGVGLTAQELGRQWLGGAGAGDGDLVAPRVEALRRETARSNRLRQIPRSCAGRTRDPAGPGHESRDRGAGEQQQGAGEHEHSQDLGAEPLEERGRRPIERFPGRSAVDGVEAVHEVAVADGVVGPQAGRLRRERKEQRGEQHDAARVERPGRGHERTHQERQAPTGERQRRDVRDPPRNVLERSLQPLSHGPSVPTNVEDEAQVDPGGHQPQSDEIEMALFEPLRQGARIATRLAQPRARARAGAGTRGPVPGRRASRATALACPKHP